MAEHTNPLETSPLPAREVIDARTEPAPALVRAVDQTTGEELTSADLRRTLLALKGLDHS